MMISISWQMTLAAILMLPYPCTGYGGSEEISEIFCSPTKTLEMSTDILKRVWWSQCYEGIQCRGAGYRRV